MALQFSLVHIYLYNAFYSTCCFTASSQKCMFLCYNSTIVFYEIISESTVGKCYKLQYLNISHMHISKINVHFKAMTKMLSMATGSHFTHLGHAALLTGTGIPGGELTWETSTG